MTTDNKQHTWERYTQMWKHSDLEAKRALCEGVLSPHCVYTDPLARTQSTDELIAYMSSFHAQFPGCHFVTTHFFTHHDCCIVRWNMVDGEGGVVSDGMSYGEFAADGSLRSMTGFFEVPAAA